MSGYLHFLITLRFSGVTLPNYEVPIIAIYRLRVVEIKFSPLFQTLRISQNSLLKIYQNRNTFFLLIVKESNIIGIEAELTLITIDRDTTIHLAISSPEISKH